MRALITGEIRRRWRSALLIGIAVGVGLGATLAAAAGARRTDTAYPRMVAATNGPELTVSAFEEDPAVRAALHDSLREIDGVQSAGELVAANLVPTDVPRGAGTPVEACSNLSSDGRAGYTIDRPNVLEGRMPRADRSDEILITSVFARAFGVGVGDEVDLVRYSANATPRAGEVSAADGPVIHVRVVGIGVFARQVVPVSDLDEAPRVFAGPAFVERHAPSQAEQCYDGISLDLAPGADLRRVTTEIDERAGGVPLLLQGRESDVDVRQAVQPQVTALYLFAAVMALATLLVVSQLVARDHQQVALTSGPTWRALGMTTRQRRSLVAAPAALTAAVGGSVGLAVAVAASGRFPVGPARAAETSPGTELHAALHVGGALAAVLAIVVVAGVAATLAVRAGPATAPAASPLRFLARGSSPSLALGAHLATGSRRAGAAVPIRSTAAGAAMVVAAVAATITVAGGLDDLVSEPSRYGQDWDVVLDGVFGPAPTGNLIEALDDVEGVEAIAGGRHGEVTIDGQRVGTVAFTDIEGSTFPAIIDGREARTGDEVVLGSRTIVELDRAIGEQVVMDAGLGPRRMTIVGTTAFPRLNRGSFNLLGLGTGAIVRGEAFPPFDVESLGLDPEADLRPFEGPGGELYEMVTVRARDDATDAERAAIVDAARAVGSDLEVVARTEQRPIALDRYAAVRSTPAALVVLLAAMVAATLGHLVATVVWRRRRDLALCQALGMERSQLRRAVGFQALLIAAISLLGLPIGVAAGRLAWRELAGDIGVVDTIRIPTGEVLAIALLTSLAATAVALVVGAVVMARRRLAAALRDG